MKTSLLTGWQARFHAVCLMMLLSALAVGAFSSTAHAQAQVAPVAEENVTVEQLPDPAAAAAVAAPAEEAAAPTFDHGDVAWMLTSTLLVLLMVVPGLALFYGGLVRSKNVLSVLSQILVVFSLVLMLWVAYGYSAVFSEGNAFFGSFTQFAFLKGFAPDSVGNTPIAGLPDYLFVAFQSTFAGITTALIVGAFAERIKFKAVLLFSALWFTLSYIPMAHIVWGGGYLGEMGAIDFAGGTVVHINAGVAGLVAAYFVGKRIGYGQTVLKPHNVPFTYIGAMLLWVGWFGFNAGSAAAADTVASLAFINTILATAAAVLGWTLVEAVSKGKPSALGAASGAVAGLVGITPACGTVGPLGDHHRLGGRRGLRVGRHRPEAPAARGRHRRRVRRARHRRHRRCHPHRCVQRAVAGWHQGRPGYRSPGVGAGGQRRLHHSLVRRGHRRDPAGGQAGGRPARNRGSRTHRSRRHLARRICV